MNFKDIMRQDVETVFFNAMEFAEEHMVDDKKMFVMLDGLEQIEREKNAGEKAEGIYTRTLLFYVKADEFGGIPKIGRSMTFDKKVYIVKNAIEEDGIYSITLEAMRN